MEKMATDRKDIECALFYRVGLVTLVLDGL